MKILKLLLEFISKIIGAKGTNSLPRKQDGNLAEDKILIIYVVVDDTDNPIYFVDVKTDGIKTEPATKTLLHLQFLFCLYGVRLGIIFSISLLLVFGLIPPK